MNRYQHYNDRTRIYMNLFYGILEEMIWGMTKVELTDSIGVNFIRRMIPHHKAAIDLSKNVLRFTQNQELRQIASEIIEEQTRSIQNMEHLECGCQAYKNSKEELCCYNDKITAAMTEMFACMRSARAVNNIGCDFISGMVPHHEGAVKMASETIAYQICPELNEILYQIIVSQKAGICRMHELSEKMLCDCN